MGASGIFSSCIAIDKAPVAIAMEKYPGNNFSIFSSMTFHIINHPRFCRHSPPLWIEQQEPYSQFSTMRIRGFVTLLTLTRGILLNPSLSFIANHSMMMSKFLFF